MSWHTHFFRVLCRDSIVEEEEEIIDDGEKRTTGRRVYQTRLKKQRSTSFLRTGKLVVASPVTRKLSRGSQTSI